MRKWMPLLAVCLGTFMLLVDVTIVTVALPNMAKDLDSSLSDLQWVLDVYALALAALLLGIGSVADQIGRRLVFVGALAMFTAASLGCAIAPNIQVLITFRIVQGIGAAGMFGATMALLGMHYRGRSRSIAFSAWGATNAVAAAAGPVFGGVLTEYLDWRWIFLVNLPVGALAIPLSMYSLAESRAPRRARTDFTGMISMTVAMAALTYALIRANGDGWSSGRIVGLFALAGVALVVFVVAEARHQHPILELRLFRRAAFTGLMVTGLLAQLAAFAYLPFTSLWLQSVLGYGAVRAGLYILPLSISALVFAALAGRFDAPPRPAILGGLLLLSGGGLLQAFLDADSTGRSLIAGLLVAGAGAGLLTPALSSAVLSTVPAERGGMAGGAVNTFRQLGFALGIAVFGTVLVNRLEAELAANGNVADPHAGAEALAGGQGSAIVAAAPPGQRDAVDRLVHASFASALDTVMVIVAIIAAVALVLAVFLIRGVRNEEYSESDEVSGVVAVPMPDRG